MRVTALQGVSNQSGLDNDKPRQLVRRTNLMFLSADPLGQWMESRERDLITAWASYFKRAKHVTSSDEMLSRDCQALHNAMLEIMSERTGPVTRP
jgi:hypothetical protein